METQQLFMRLIVLLLLAATCESSRDISLQKILRKRDVAGAGTAPAVAPAVALPPSKAQEFLSKLKRTKRNIWDRSRPDVQQWIQQFLYMGFDEQRLEADLSYWMDQSRSSDQGRQHHYDENAPIGPRDPSAYRHGANVNYDYY